MLRLRIDTDGDAFARGMGRQEVADILRALAYRIVHFEELDGSVRDRNGNTCGQWDLRFERSQEEDTDA